MPLFPVVRTEFCDECKTEFHVHLGSGGQKFISGGRAKTPQQQPLHIRSELAASVDSGCCSTECARLRGKRNEERAGAVQARIEKLEKMNTELRSVHEEQADTLVSLTAEREESNRRLMTFAEEKKKLESEVQTLLRRLQAAESAAAARSRPVRESFRDAQNALVEARRQRQSTGNSTATLSRSNDSSPMLGFLSRSPSQSSDTFLSAATPCSYGSSKPSAVNPIHSLYHFLHDTIQPLISQKPWDTDIETIQSLIAEWKAINCKPKLPAEYGRFCTKFVAVVQPFLNGVVPEAKSRDAKILRDALPPLRSRLSELLSEFSFPAPRLGGTGHEKLMGKWVAAMERLRDCEARWKETNERQQRATDIASDNVADLLRGAADALEPGFDGAFTFQLEPLLSALQAAAEKELEWTGSYAKRCETSLLPDVAIAAAVAEKLLLEVSEHVRAVLECENQAKRPFDDAWMNRSTVPEPVSNVPAPARGEYVKGERIGQGGFGAVYKGMNKLTGELVAIKEVRFHGNRSAELKREFDLLQQLRHPNIVKLVGFSEADGLAHIVMEFVPGGSLASLLAQFGRLPETAVSRFTLQVLSGLVYLHANAIIHCDIKPANLLCTDKGVIKLADFGAATVITDTPEGNLLGTPFYMAPEVFRTQRFSEMSDIWALGCTVLELLEGERPWSQFKGYSAISLVVHIGGAKEPPLISGQIGGSAREFLESCLTLDAENRPAATRLLLHPFVTVEEQTSTTEALMQVVVERRRTSVLQLPPAVTSDSCRTVDTAPTETFSSFSTSSL